MYVSAEFVSDKERAIEWAWTDNVAKPGGWVWMRWCATTTHALDSDTLLGVTKQNGGFWARRCPKKEACSQSLRVINGGKVFSARVGGEPWSFVESVEDAHALWEDDEPVCQECHVDMSFQGYEEGTPTCLDCHLKSLPAAV